MLFFVSLNFLVSLSLSVFLMSLFLIQEFFRNLSHWIDQHAAMNDSGNFLIETCDETVSLDLKQQLLLLNGRWRDLFLQVKQVTNKNILKIQLKYSQENLIKFYFLVNVLFLADYFILNVTIGTI